MSILETRHTSPMTCDFRMNKAQWWNGTNRWFKVGTGYGQGYMIATQVSNQTSVGHC